MTHLSLPPPPSNVISTSHLDKMSTLVSAQDISCMANPSTLPFLISPSNTCIIDSKSRASFFGICPVHNDVIDATMDKKTQPKKEQHKCIDSR